MKKKSVNGEIQYTVDTLSRQVRLAINRETLHSHEEDAVTNLKALFKKERKRLKKKYKNPIYFKAFTDTPPLPENKTMPWFQEIQHGIAKFSGACATISNGPGVVTDTVNVNSKGAGDGLLGLLQPKFTVGRTAYVVDSCHTDFCIPVYVESIDQSTDCDFPVKCISFFLDGPLYFNLKGEYDISEDGSLSRINLINQDEYGKRLQEIALKKLTA